MPDWKTRLAVSYTDDSGTAVLISPIDSFSPSFSLNTELLHSLQATHIGAVFNPSSITFSMTVRAIGPVAGQLTALAMQGKRFSLVMQESEGDDWAFKTIVLRDCIITSASPSAANVTGAPTATFSGISLQSQVEPKVGAPATTGRR